MRPVSTVARKEIAELRRDGRLRWALGAVGVLLLVAAAGGWQQYRERRAEIAIAQAADRAAWEGQGARNPHSAAHFGQYAFKPLQPLAAIEPGVDDYAGAAIWMEAHYQDPARFRAAEDRTPLARLGSLTAAAVVQHLLPLVIVLASFAAVAGERERGTWRQLLAQGVRPSVLATGKLLGLGAFLLPPLLVAAGVGGAVSAASVPAGASDLLARWALLAAASLLYLIAWLGAAVAVSAFAGSSRQALLILLGLWIANAVVLPRAAADFAAWLAPTPAATDFWASVAEDQAKGIDGHNPSSDRTKALQEEVLARYGVKTLEELPVNFDGIAMQAGEEYGNQVFDRRWGATWDAYQRQERIQAWLGVLAPSIALRGLSMAVAGTDVAHHRHFADGAEAHRRRINRELNEHFRDHAGREGFDWLAPADFWSTLPSLEYRSPTLAWALAPRLPELGLLVAWTLAALIAAVVACRRALSL